MAFVLVQSIWSPWKLGPRSDLEIRQQLDAQVGADRWTKPDCLLGAESFAQWRKELWTCGLQPMGGGKGHLHACKIGGMRKLKTSLRQFNYADTVTVIAGSAADIRAMVGIIWSSGSGLGVK